VDEDVMAFIANLRQRGIECYVHNNRLKWPKPAWAQLTELERAFFRAHRAELKALATSGVLPETCIVHTQEPAKRIRETEWG
jgi:hypothetical protein